MKCILQRCVHQGGACQNLGECGAAYALRRALRPEGYLVIERDNPTIDALRAKALVRSVAAGKRRQRVFATEKE